MIDEKLSYNEIIEKISFDEPVSLRNRKTGLYVSGYVREYFFSDINDGEELFYISIYCFNTRTERLFILDKELYLNPADLSLNETEEADINMNDDAPESAPGQLFRPAFIRIVLFITVVSIITGGVDFSSFTPSVNISYDSFLKKNYSFESLAGVVYNRLKYTSDYTDLWHTPEFAWNNRFGDCEEYAGIITEYLNRHGIAAWIIAVNLKRGSAHAMTIAYHNDHYYIIDPLRSAERSRVRKFNKNMKLSDIISLYSFEKPSFYRIPELNGDKTPIQLDYEPLF